MLIDITRQWLFRINNFNNTYRLNKMSTAFKKALAKKKTAEVSLFDEDIDANKTSQNERLAVDNASSSDSDAEYSSDSSSAA